MTVVHETQDILALPDALQQDQLTAIFEEHYEEVVAYLRHRFFSKHPEIAEDIAQETFVKVVSKIQSYSGEGNIMGWIITIAYHTACDYFRKKGNTHQLPTEADLLDRPEERDGTATLDRIALDQILEQSKVGKNVFNALYLLENGWKYKEVATELGININTLKAQVRSARRALRPLIEQHFEPIA